MTTTAELSDEFVTLYFDFPHGRAVDLKTLGTTLLEFENFSRLIAARADPYFDFEIVFSQSEAGSLKILTKLRQQITTKRLKTVANAIVFALVFRIIGVISDDEIREMLEMLGYPEETLSDTEVQQIREAVTDACKSNDVQKSKSAIFASLDASEEITGFGAKPDTSPEKPFIVVPKGDFATFANTTSEVESEAPTTREVTSKAELVILTPVLSQNSKARWQFYYGGHKIDARVTDLNFLKKALSGAERIPLIEGLILQVALVDHQFFKDGVWQHKSYEVKHVERWTAPRTQERLFPDSGQN